MPTVRRPRGLRAVVVGVRTIVGTVELRIVVAVVALIAGTEIVVTVAAGAIMVVVIRAVQTGARTLRLYVSGTDVAVVAILFRCRKTGGSCEATGSDGSTWPLQMN